MTPKRSCIVRAASSGKLTSHVGAQCVVRDCGGVAAGGCCPWTLHSFPESITLNAFEPLTSVLEQTWERTVTDWLEEFVSVTTTKRSTRGSRMTVGTISQGEADSWPWPLSDDSAIVMLSLCRHSSTDEGVRLEVRWSVVSRSSYTWVYWMFDGDGNYKMVSRGRSKL